MSHTYEAIYDNGQVTWLNDPPNIRKARIQVTVIEDPVSGLSPAEELEQVKTQLLELKPMLQEAYHITELGIFGSYVRGEQTVFSDVDILVDFDPSFRLDLLTYGRIEDEISEILEKKVDLVMKRGLKPNIGKNILREVIYLWPQETSATTSKTCSTTSPPPSD
ncbi:nucleotidyltransferase family protein [Leptothoe sp. PORK10 BA2]|uniref:nucleotidyltransferase family protein n=1 Tax=Leptothoe sp. PORK10 BA2 TaxID=3110254 RepID=UPI002B1F0885|nr:nucleotidyltransferase family protein [Leptothoe sp. PORK10 BA2]MEA5465555.1 nucleotidyltransferase family protein [Leptothoe sp. PORK10 BA2]